MSVHDASSLARSQAMSIHLSIHSPSLLSWLALAPVMVTHENSGEGALHQQTEYSGSNATLGQQSDSVIDHHDRQNDGGEKRKATRPATTYRVLGQRDS